MSQGNWDEPNPYRDPQPPHERPAAKKSSGGRKVLIILLVLGGGGLLLCCGCIGIFWYQATQSISDKPEVVQQRMQEMLNITIPEAFQPVATMGVNLPLVPEFRLTAYQPTAAEGLLMFIHIEMPFTPAEFNEAQMEQALQQQRGNQQVKELNITETETRQFDVGGQKVSVVFSEGADENGTVYNQVMGAFPSKSGSGTVMMMLQMEAEGYDEEQVVEMIESIE